MTKTATLKSPAGSQAKALPRPEKGVHTCPKKRQTARKFKNEAITLITTASNFYATGKHRAAGGARTYPPRLIAS
ncbi:MAG: hypothetical protein DHS20C08_10690 [Rhodomicrobium sp.]|nr:MAG: hypothetical protein DHS20C08_10690 [Rhodomicrobium sp.]